MTNDSLIDSIEELTAACSNGDQMWELGFNCARNRILRLIRNHPAPDVERVRIAILEAMNINYTTYSYRYVAEAAIAAMGDASTRKDEGVIAPDLSTSPAFDDAYLAGANAKIYPVDKNGIRGTFLPSDTAISAMGVVACSDRVRSAESERMATPANHFREVTKMVKSSEISDTDPNIERYKKLSGLMSNDCANDVAKVALKAIDAKYWKDIASLWTPLEILQVALDRYIDNPIKSKAKPAEMPLSDFSKWYSENGYHHDTLSPRRELMEIAWNAARATKPVFIKHHIVNAPVNKPVIVAGGIAMQRECGTWFTGMSEPIFQRPLEWQPNWFAYIDDDNSLKGVEP